MNRRSDRTGPHVAADSTQAETLAQIFERTPAVAFKWAATAGWPILYASVNVASWGYDADDLCRRRQLFAELIHPDDLRRILIEAEQQHEQGMEGNRHQYRLRTAHGSWLWVDDQTWIEHDAAGSELTLNGVVVDISESKRTERALHLAASALPSVLNERTDTGAAIEELMARLGSGAGADRVYLFEHYVDAESGELMTSQRHEWCRVGIKAQIDNPELQELSLEQQFPRWAESFRSGRAIFGAVKDFPPSEREIFQAQAIQSVLVVPIMLDEQPWGFLGFDAVLQPRLWSVAEQQMLQIAALGLGAAIVQARSLAALESGEERLRLTLQAAGAGAWQWDPRAGQSQWNDQHFRLLALDSGERAKANALWRQRLHPADLAEVEKSLASSVETGKPLDIEYRIVLAEGEVRWLHALGNRWRDDLGEPAGLIGIVLDVTERRRIEDRLRLSTAVIEATRDGVLVTDLEPRMVSANRAFSEITGYEEAEVDGRDPRILDSGRHDGDFYQRLASAVSQTGQWQGELWIRCKNGAIRPLWATINTVADAYGKATHYVAVLTDVSRLKQTEDRLQHLAHYDPLTDLPNRLLVQSRLDHLLTRAGPGDRMALLFVDVDGFKMVNDGLGHTAGDHLLTSIAKRFDAQLGERQTLARLGGDEFLLLLEAIESPGEAALAAQNLLQVFDQPFALPGEDEVYASASVGIALFPVDGRSSDELIRNADAAMYQAKASGRSTYQFYTSSLTRSANDRLALHGRLRRALVNQEFRLHYQPVIDVVSNRLVGLEALLRWYPPGQEMVLPSEFISVAEETGLILALGDWVLREACQQLAKWRAEGMPPVKLAVNLSARQLQQPGIVWQLQDALEEAQLPAEVLELELTESTLMEQGEHVVDTLTALRALGVSLAIDDFGTGYSSLAYLKRFPVQTLKIDRSFVSDLANPCDGGEIAAAIIALGRSLHLAVVAEGVECQEQLDFLRRHRCHAYQGFMVSKALDASALQRWLADWSA